MAPVREGAHDPGRPLSPAARLVLRVTLAILVVLAGVLTVAFVDANWRFAHLEAAAPARLLVARTGRQHRPLRVVETP